MSISRSDGLLASHIDIIGDGTTGQHKNLDGKTLPVEAFTTASRGAGHVKV
jgi:hypothetical protein